MAMCMLGQRGPRMHTTCLPASADQLTKPCVQMPGPPYSSDKVAGRMIMACYGETQNSGKGLLLGTWKEDSH